MKDHDVGIRPRADFWQIETVIVYNTWWTFTHSHLLEVAIAFRAKFEGSAHSSHARRPTVLPDNPISSDIIAGSKVWTCVVEAGVSAASRAV
jgi:hypothetical protein